MLNELDMMPPTLGEASPSERVRQYLRECSASLSEGEHLKLPSARQLADQLHVSQRTAASVYRVMAKQGSIRTRVGDGSYLLGRPRGSGSPAGRSSKEMRIGLGVHSVVRDPHRDYWKDQITGGVLDTASRVQPSAVILPFEVSENPAEMSERVIAMCDRVDGVILLPTPEPDEIIASYARAGKAVVSLNPVRDADTANFVAADHYAASLRLGNALASTGRKRLLYLLSGPLERSVSSRKCLSGLIAGVGHRLGDPVQVRIARTDGPEESQGYDVIKAYLAANPAPDAVYAAGDLLALGSLRALTEHGLSIPRDVSVIGATGDELSDTPYPGLTRSRQPLRAMGEGLLLMAERLIKFRQVSTPGQYLPMPFIGGATTLSQENLRLEIEL